MPSSHLIDCCGPLVPFRIAFKPLAPGERMSPATMSTLVAMFVEVLDIAQMRPIVSQRFPDFLTPLAGSVDHVFTVRFTSDDSIVLDVFRVEAVIPR